MSPPHPESSSNRQFEESETFDLSTQYDEQQDSSPGRSEGRAPPEPNSPDFHAPASPDLHSEVSTVLRSSSLDDDQKLAFLVSLAPEKLNRLYEDNMAFYGLPRRRSAPGALSAPEAPSCAPGELSEGTYRPLVRYTVPSPDPGAPRPIYGAYVGYFATSADARRHRKRIRVPPKSQAPDVERVKRFGRRYWVRRIYEAMIDITDVADGEHSIHRQRMAHTVVFDVADLEATAHNVFDAAIAVHERGWNRSIVYHKKVVRGKLVDVSEKSLERRLGRICLCLRHKKATVDDAVRGGVTLALLCDNPEARGFTKMSNNTGNQKRGERLRRAKNQESGGQDEQEEEDEQEDESE